LSSFVDCVDLRFRWPDGKGLSKLCLEAGGGEVTALIGRNGAGKTTLLNLVMGLLVPEDGRISILGQRIDPGKDVGYKAKIGYCPAQGGLIDNLSVKENFELVAYLRCGRKKAWREQSRWIEGFWLSGSLNARIEELSSGQRRRAMIASALIGSPPIIILDEPGNDLDIEGLFILKELLAACAGEGRAILVSTHILDVVRNAHGRVAFLENGEKVYEGGIASEKSLEETYRELIWGNGKASFGDTPDPISP
jgi:ABC-type multidrug transport system ATPase subunit